MTYPDEDDLFSRRRALALGAGAATVLATAPGWAGAEPRSKAADRNTPSESRQTWKRGAEGERLADLGDGTFLNPVLSGDRPDPSILRDGDDYYATFTSFVYYPAVVSWHSRDLVNWTPIGPALRTPLGSVFAIDLAKHDGRFFAYIPVLVVPPNGIPAGPPFKIYVVHAESMHGPWSEPIDMKIDGFIDPGHAVGEDGRRYLFLSDGHRVRISDDGLSRDGPITKVYDGWRIPDTWVIEGFALEGPKILRRGDWFYMFSGEGGTAGPPTSHMVVVARSRSIDGPWENCPHNPIVRTVSRTEPWWSRGHATAVQGPRGDWWLVYHGYENGYRTLGRQMLLEPISWGADDWPHARGGDLGRPIRKPVPSVRPRAGLSLSDDFTQEKLGTHYAFYQPKARYADRLNVGGGSLSLTGQGTTVADSSPLAWITGDHAYDFSIDVDLGDATQAGLLLFYNDKLFCGLGLSDKALHTYVLGHEQLFPPAGRAPARLKSLRVVNDANVATFYYKVREGSWVKVTSFDVEGYNHNMGDGFLSLRPAIFAVGGGKSIFRALRYSANSVRDGII